MPLDGGVVHLDGGVDELVRIASPLPVPLPELRIDKPSVLGRVNLNVRATQPGELVDLAPHEVHHVCQVGVASRVGSTRLVRLVEGRGLGHAGKGDLRGAARPGSEVGELLSRHVSSPPELSHHHRAWIDLLFPCLVPEGNPPPAKLVEPLQGIDEVAKPDIAPLLAVGEHVYAGCLLQSDRLIHRPVLDPLELGEAEVACLTLTARLE